MFRSEQSGGGQNLTVGQCLHGQAVEMVMRVVFCYQTITIISHGITSCLVYCASRPPPPQNLDSALCSTFVGAASVDRASTSESAIMKKWRFGTDDSVGFMTGGIKQY